MTPKKIPRYFAIRLQLVVCKENPRFVVGYLFLFRVQSSSFPTGGALALDQVVRPFKNKLFWVSCNRAKHWANKALDAMKSHVLVCLVLARLGRKGVGGCQRTRHWCTSRFVFVCPLSLPLPSDSPLLSRSHGITEMHQVPGSLSCR